MIVIVLWGIFIVLKGRSFVSLQLDLFLENNKQSNWNRWSKDRVAHCVVRIVDNVMREWSKVKTLLTFVMCSLSYVALLAVITTCKFSLSNFYKKEKLLTNSWCSPTHHTYQRFGIQHKLSDSSSKWSCT